MIYSITVCSGCRQFRKWECISVKGELWYIVNYSLHYGMRLTIICGRKLSIALQTSIIHDTIQIKLIVNNLKPWRNFLQVHILEMTDNLSKMLVSTGVWKPKHDFIKKSISFRVRCLVAVIKVFCWFYFWPFKLYANSVLHSHYFSAFNSFFSIWWLRWVVWKNSFKIIIENNLVNKYSVFSEENMANT